MKKIFIVGSGNVSRTLLYGLMTRLTIEIAKTDSKELYHIYYYSRKQEKAEEEIKQYQAGLSDIKRITLNATANINDMFFSDIVIQTAGIKAAHYTSRTACLGQNCKLAFDFARQVIEHAPDALVLNVTNPTTHTTTTIVEQGLEANKVIGIGTGIDVNRFKREIATLLNKLLRLALAPSDVKAEIIGAHLKKHMHFSLSSISIKGQLLEQFLAPYPLKYSAQKIVDYCQKKVRAEGRTHLTKTGNSASVTPVEEIINIIRAYLFESAAAYETHAEIYQNVDNQALTEYRGICLSRQLRVSHNTVIISDLELDEKQKTKLDLLVAELKKNKLSNKAAIEARVTTEIITQTSLSALSPREPVKSFQYNQKGLELLLEAANRNPSYRKSPQYYIDQAKWYFIHGHYKKTIDLLNSLLMDYTDNVHLKMKIYLDLGMAHMAIGDISSVKSSCINALLNWKKVNPEVELSELGNIEEDFEQIGNTLKIPHRFKIEKKITSEDINSPCRVFNNIGNLLLYTAMSKADYERAEKYYSFALKICRTMDEENKLYEAIAMTNLAHAEALIGKTEQAIKRNARSQRLLKKVFPKNKFHRSSFLNNTGNILLLCDPKNKKQLSLICHLHAMQLLRECYPEMGNNQKRHFDLAYCAYNIFLDYQELEPQNIKLAKKWYQEAKTLAIEHLPKTHMFRRHIINTKEKHFPETEKQSSSQQQLKSQL